MKIIPKIAVVIPCYKVSNQILKVISHIGIEVSRIYIIDDLCPEKSGDLVEKYFKDDRIVIIRNLKNLGVGGAVMAGYKAAINDGMEIMVKIDGDGQMDPDLIPDFIAPIISGVADFTKGNRFFDLEVIRTMPTVRLFGNAALSFMSKLSSGYWNLFDPTNGYTAIHRDIAIHLPFIKISRRYFFETDILFRLNTLRAVVVDIPMVARYGDEISNLKIYKIIGEFFFKHIRNFGKRIFYNYYLRDWSLASIELPLGLGLFAFGFVFGTYQWFLSTKTGLPSSSGTVMLSALPIIIGMQLILAFLGHDIRAVPNRALHQIKRNSRSLKSNEEIQAQI